MTKKVVILDELPRKVYSSVFEGHDIDVVDRRDLNESGLERALREAHAIIVRSSTFIEEDFFARTPNLEVIGRAGTGTDTIDVVAATERGVLVTNTPDENTTSASELTIGFMYSLARNIPKLHNALRAGNWGARSEYLGTELRGKTLGIFGLGSIGSEVAAVANAIGMNVIGNDPFISRDRLEEIGVRYVEKEELLRESDYVTLHVNLTPSTQGMIGSGEFEIMKEGVRIINCARGGLIDEEALVNSLRSGKVAGAGIDVYKQEPVEPSNPLLGLDNVITTPHAGASTGEAQTRVATAISRQVANYLTVGSIDGAVNLAEVDIIVEPYIPLVEKMGVMTHHLFDGGDIRLQLYGDIANVPDDNLMRAFLKGYLSANIPGVNMVSAMAKASGLGIQTSEERIDSTGNPYSLVRVEIGGDESRSIEGELHKGSPEIVGINGYRISFEPRGHVLYTEHSDVPGVVEHVSGTLARLGMNLGSVIVARESIGGNAVGFVELDEGIDNSVVGLIRNDDRIHNVKHFYIP
tara:strand:+ start:20085 stop:21653 length:1569 start_codon:yes stop_codon:yes gene_type:complete